MALAGREKQEVRVGSLSRRVTVQRAAEARDSHGGVSRTWSDLITVWARVEPRGGGESQRAGAVEATVNHKVTIRHGSGIDAKDRVVWEGRVLKLIAILAGGPGRFDELSCAEVV